MNKIIKSNDADTDTLKCPKCGAIWRSSGFYSYDSGGWEHEEMFCPCGCKSFFRIPVRGNIIAYGQTEGLS